MIRKCRRRVRNYRYKVVSGRWVRDEIEIKSISTLCGCCVQTFQEQKKTTLKRTLKLKEFRANWKKW